MTSTDATLTRIGHAVELHHHHGRREAACEQLQLARAGLGELGDGNYGRLIRGSGLDRLAGLL